MGDHDRTTETIIPRYNSVPFSTTPYETHELLLTEGRGQVENILGERNMQEKA
jgi:hypothetical protein